MVTGKSPIVPMTWATQQQPSSDASDASEEVPMVTQLDGKEALMGIGQSQLGESAQEVQGLCKQVPTRGEVPSRG
jgi:hypothetical protein